MHAQQDRDLIRLGNGIAAIAEGEIITLEQLRKELEPIIPRLRVEAKNEQEFAARIDQLSKEVLQNMIDRILIVKAAEEKGSPATTVLHRSGIRRSPHPRLRRRPWPLSRHT